MDDIREIARDALGEEPSSIEHVPTIEDSRVFRIVVPSGVVFFKSEHEGHPIANAAWAYREGARLGVPVPEVLHLDLSRERWAEEYMIVTAVAGSDLENDPLTGGQLIGAIEAYGDLLRRLHGRVLDGFGDLVVGSAESVRGEFDDHGAYLRDRPNWGLPYLLDHGLLPPTVGDQIGEVLARHEELVTAPDRGVFIHGDPGLDHLFVERVGMTVTGLIDFEPESADPVMDLAIFGYHYPDLFAYLVEGYGAVPDDLQLRLELYGLIRGIGSVRWEHERVPNVAPDVEDLVERAGRVHGMLR